MDAAPEAAAPPSPILTAVSEAPRAEDAAREVARGVDPARTAFVLVFPHERIDPARFAAALAEALPGVAAFGCTTAGQITPQGYASGSTLLVAFPRAHFRFASLLIRPLSPFSMRAVSAEARALESRFPRNARWRRLALTFADGLSRQEDMLAATLAAALPDLPVFGGSAGDGLAFAETCVLHGGQFQKDAALLLLLETDLEFASLGFDHFAATERRMVVTDAVPEERLVLELNGSPAAAEYARAVGCDVAALSPRVFAENPFLVRNNALYHVRAIQAVRDGQALSFLSAIDDGLMLTLGQSVDILGTLRGSLGIRDAAGRPPGLVLGFDCVLRRLEIESRGLSDAASAILSDARVVGFNTYGEQHLGLHVNQTFVGVAFFGPSGPDLR